MASSALLYSWAPSARDLRVRLFELSAKNAGVAPRILNCSSLLEKPVALAKAIAGLPDDAIVVASDSFDVLCLKPSANVAERFHQIGKPIVFGAERQCFHHFHSSRVSFEASASGTYNYLNCGLFAGFAGHLNQMLATIASWDSAALAAEFKADSRNVGSFNDQTLFGRYAEQNPEIVGLDREAQICWNAAGEYECLEAELNRPEFDWTNPATGSAPAFLHVTQVRKYYPLYLLAALELGLEVDGGTADIELFDQHLSKTVPNIDAHAVEMSPRVQRALRPTFGFRRLKAGQEIVRRWKALRMDIGKTRRMLFRIGQR